MSQNDPYTPPQSGDTIPPPPQYQGAADIPPESPYHYSPAPKQRTRGAFGWLTTALLAAWGVVKYGLILVGKVPALATVLTGLLSVGAYALLFPWQVAVGIVAMIFVHEMGHVVEIRRQGMAATAPIFVPFFGAAIFMRQHAQSPIRQAEIGIAGPIAGTLAAVAALVLFASTRVDIFLVWAYFGFWINLFNLIPFGMLDGGWILAPVSKWVQVAGLVVLGALFFTGQVNPFILLVVLIGLPTIFRRFRDKAYDAYLTSGPLAPRVTIGVLWLALVVFLGVAFYQTEGLLHTVLR